MQYEGKKEKIWFEKWGVECELWILEKTCQCMRLLK